MIKEISEKCKEVIIYGYDINMADKDGLKAWQVYKNEHSSDKTTFQLSPEFINLLDKIEYIKHEDDKEHKNVKIIIDDIATSNSVLHYHFFVQLFRIPKTTGNVLPLVKLLQICYNIGQLKASIEKNLIDEKVKKFIIEHKLLDINTFLY